MNNKVYINPKFNRTSYTNIPTNNKMHVNPKFSQHMMQNNSRIYVNPHFIKSNVSCASAQSEICYKRDDDSSKKPFSSQQTAKVIENIASKSRYSLVRKTATQDTPNQTIFKATTIKINKYKSVAIRDFRKKLDVKVSQQATDKIPAPVRAQQQFHSCDKKVSSPKPKETFPYLGGYNLSKSNIKTRFKLRNIPLSSVKNVSLSSPFKAKVKRNFKKNNIPCPLFKKYGKCLRSLQGTCDFLHDKKHVSICRKFMKGICHDKGCLLSHEITSNKMPTCYFYLKGMCAKENCPYVHVKLNEKTKVCSEFMKGYCDKGDKCLNRHVAINPVTEKNKSTKKINSSKKNNTIKHTNDSKYKTTVKQRFIKVASSIAQNDEALSKNCETDKRYFKEQTTTDEIAESSEVIKPTRCKLGTLPSFIKL